MKKLLIISAALSTALTLAACSSEPQPIEKLSLACDGMLERIDDARERLDCACMVEGFSEFEPQLINKLTTLFTEAEDQRDFEKHFEREFTESEMETVMKKGRECEG